MQAAYRCDRFEINFIRKKILSIDNKTIIISVARVPVSIC